MTMGEDPETVEGLQEEQTLPSQRPPKPDTGTWSLVWVLLAGVKGGMGSPPLRSVFTYTETPAPAKQVAGFIGGERQGVKRMDSDLDKSGMTIEFSRAWA